MFATRTQKDPKTGFREIKLLFGSFLRRPFVSDPVDVLCLRLRVFFTPLRVFLSPLRCLLFVLDAPSRFFIRVPPSTRADRFSRPPFGGYPPSLISVGIVRHFFANQRWRLSAGSTICRVECRRNCLDPKGGIILSFRRAEAGNGKQSKAISAPFPRNNAGFRPISAWRGSRAVGLIAKTAKM